MIRARRTRVWRSPADQPGWARPALLLVTGVAGVAYAWSFDRATLEPFYAGAARSMSSSWHDFFFGAFDPAGTVTVDKLPGALWVQAISLRVFGFHIWAVVLPQVLAGMLTILVLYRAVRRLAGPVAGITAAVVLAITPVTVALNRGNVSDSLLILLTVLAADAASAALLTGRLRSLLMAGLWVGLAFQAKMMQAWLVLPALLVAYLVAAPGRVRRRLAHAAAAAALAAAVSVSWMSIVSLVPGAQRPFVDGTLDDSPFSQVFLYNGLSRLRIGHGLGEHIRPAAFIEKLVRAGQTINVNTSGVPASWHRLLEGVFGRDWAWLLPAALIAAAAVLRHYRGASRRSPMRACVVLWLLWLVVIAAFFSEGIYLNSYYVAALAPAVAALCGTGVALVSAGWEDRRARGALALAVLVSVGYGIRLLSGADAGPGWLAPLAAILGIAGVLIASSGRIGLPLVRRLPPLSVAVACGLLLPAAASAIVVTRSLGPFDEPFRRALPTISPQRKFEIVGAYLDALENESIASFPLATYSSLLAAPFIAASGREVLPIGGYSGGVPSPTVAQLERYVATRQLATFLIPLTPASRDPRIVWVLKHCKRGRRRAPGSLVELTVFRCTPSVARG